VKECLSLCNGDLAMSLGMCVCERVFDEFG
jgi:hypothetical protein